MSIEDESGGGAHTYIRQHASEDPAETTSSKSTRGAHAKRSAGRGLGSTIGWTILGTVVPGVGLIKSGRKILGTIVLVLFVGAGITAAALTLFNRNLLLNFAANRTNLLTITWVLGAVALAWVLVIVGSHIALRGAQPVGQRAAGAAVVAVLAFAVTAPMAIGANYTYTSFSFVGAVFAEEKSDNVPSLPTEVIDPWADFPRVNVLILGGDSGEGRNVKNGIRPDTVIVASINTKTGATTLISLPRNLAKMPFPKDSPLSKYYPQGFTNGDPANQEFMLNAMYRNIPARVPKKILGKTSNLGADVMKVSVGEALGLKIDYYVLVNLDGFKKIINALGGISININYRVPIGGKTDLHVKPRGYLEPGPDQHLSGYKALWYARGRYGLTDYSRMERQRCVINAVAKQADLSTVLTNFTAIAAAGKDMVLTDIPQDNLGAFVELATRVQGTSLRSITFVTGEDGFSSANPDFKKMKSKVKKALKETDAQNVSKTSPEPGDSAPSSSVSPTGNPTPSKSAKPKSADLDDACAYHPEKKKK